MNPCGHKECTKYAVEMRAEGIRYMKFVYVCCECEASWNDNINISYSYGKQADVLMKKMAHLWADAFLSARGDLVYFIDQ